jgi:hypothetical protein
MFAANTPVSCALVCLNCGVGAPLYQHCNDCDLLSSPSHLEPMSPAEWISFWLEYHECNR